MTEITDITDIDRGTIFFDSACGVCRGGAGRMRSTLRRHGFRLEPLQSPLAGEATGASDAALLEELHVLTPSLGVLRGMDALLYIAAAIPWARPLRWIAKLPGALPLLRRGYRFIAAHRYGLSAACGFAGSTRPNTPCTCDQFVHKLVPALLVGATIFFTRPLAPWAWMWFTAIAIYAACKWLTWLPARHLTTPARSALYLLTYPGMDATNFALGTKPAPPTSSDWISAATRALAGVAFIWLVARRIVNLSPMLAGWCGMIGLALLFHFGVLQLTVLALRRAGIPAEPLMHRPTRATSLAQFWGRRWNSGFRTLSHDWIFRPLARRGWSVFAATGVVFLASGLLHDLVISVPARGGYGRPTLYFVIQFAGVLIERSPLLRRLMPKRGITRALAGWFLMAIFTLGPLSLLFHHAFVVNVMLPFLHVIGGLP